MSSVSVSLEIYSKFNSILEHIFSSLDLFLVNFFQFSLFLTYEVPIIYPPSLTYTLSISCLAFFIFPHWYNIITFHIQLSFCVCCKQLLNDGQVTHVIHVSLYQIWSQSLESGLLSCYFLLYLFCVQLWFVFGRIVKCFPVAFSMKDSI